MRFTAVAVILSLALSAAARPGMEGMASIVKRGGGEICTDGLNGDGELARQATKDCCAAVKQKAYFSELLGWCMPNAGPAGNSVNTGKMVTCCTSRGKGSRQVS